MRVDQAIGQHLAAAGVSHVFGVVGSGNFHVTNALNQSGARFVAARHEGGAATMADAFARMSGEVGVLSVHQGCGLTNAVTGIAEAAKSRTPMLVLAPQAVLRHSNFWIEQQQLATSVGAVARTVTSAQTAVAEALAALDEAREQRRTVLLNLPIDILAEEITGDGEYAVRRASGTSPVEPDAEAVQTLADLLLAARKPVFVAGRGSRGKRGAEALTALAAEVGALVGTSAVANGLFAGNPWSLGIVGGFSTPEVADLVHGADLIVGWGCALNMWTMRSGKLISEEATVVQVDLEREALGAHRAIDLGVVGDVAATAAAVRAHLASRLTQPREGYRTAAVGARIAAGGHWTNVPVEDEHTGDRIDPRILSRTLDAALPDDRVVAVDSGNFMGYPAAYLRVPDEDAFCFTQAFQSIGLGLATGIGAALAQPHRLPVVACGDGGFLMGVSELETVVRLRLPMVIVVYNDAGYGAEVHHFGPDGHELDTVTFPDVDIASLARSLGCEAATVREARDLDIITTWLAGPRDRPLVIDAKTSQDLAAWWLVEAFGH
ncbi:thiamine pyrophosphate-binding protein [Georgenia yuyongxinii]|uniref:Thiamine pyrophosphate-binding protein n=1 Tax=Georgenia yuyongxinii TaxID=2589797 RepID=A0A5B8C8B8_9MICO|nr:thiamine pyrophosphate-binding protein [Georgenia yuyongxinii]QDC25711.1 thiamine pyrophosphate-binding protein [Georgenia yuyongxinii]